MNKTLDSKMVAYWFKVNQTKFINRKEKYKAQVDKVCKKLSNRHNVPVEKMWLTTGYAGTDFIDNRITLRVHFDIS